jgi:zinc-binding alcohol dehydrogenase family protein
MIPEKMNAYGFVDPKLNDDLPIFEKREVDVPKPKDRQLLVEIKAVSVNPTDLATRAGKEADDDSFTILGRDAAGVVVDTGSEASLFDVGAEVYYPSSPVFEGTEADYHVIDERMVARKPTNLSFADAAALPLTALTSYEVLHDRLDLFHLEKNPEDTSLLIMGAAGGVGAIASQIAINYGFDVIGTASREESSEYLKELGVKTIIDHSEPLAEQLETHGYQKVDAVFLAVKAEENIEEASKVVKPQGRINTLLSFENPLPNRLFTKSITLSYELMYTRSLFETADWVKQHDYLTELTEKIEAGEIKTTASEVYSEMNTDTITQAYTLLQQEHTVGKIVLEHSK